MTPRCEPCAWSTPKPSAWNCRVSTAVTPSAFSRSAAWSRRNCYRAKFFARSQSRLSVGRKTYDIGDIVVLDDGIKVQLK
jgi:hypothetical protein